MKRSAPLLRGLFTCISAVITTALYLLLPLRPLVQPIPTTAADPPPPDALPVSAPEIVPQQTDLLFEAEHLPLGGGITTAGERKGASGGLYLTGFPAHDENALVFRINVPTTQHYSVTVCAAASENRRVTNALRTNGVRLSPFSLDDPEHFVQVTFYEVFLEAGENQITIETIDGGIDVDYIALKNDTAAYDLGFATEQTLCTPEPSPEAEKLYDFLREQWGQHILTGQYVPGADAPELEHIRRVTGQLPAIRFSALGTPNDRASVDSAIEWSLHQNGLVGLIWQWNAPGGDSMYARDCSFPLADALKKTDPEKLALLPVDEAQSLAERGQLSEDAVLLLGDIDSVAASLVQFRNMNIPVLWRPLHEAGGGWFWWGASGAESYQKLWALLYHRLTEYHGLNNLIWIWNGQSAAYLVPADTYDIAAADLYLSPETQFGSRCEQFLALARLTRGKKLLALSECSALPDPRCMITDSAVWSFCGLWYGEYFRQAGGNSASLNSDCDLYNLYNSELSLSLNDFLSLYQ